MSVYAVSDLHGMIGLYQQICNFLKPDDIVYCLGDCGDRGPAPWETIKAVASNPQFIYMKGNHEDMLEQAMKDYLNDGRFDENFALLCYNGGADTFTGWIEDGAKSSWYHYLRKLPLYLEYESKSGFTIQLCHAGFTPGESFPIDEDLIWDRSHFRDKCIPEDLKTICVHGHTPIPLMVRGYRGMLKNIFGAEEDGYKNGAFWYCGNHKVNIDCGSFATNQTVLLDLDTFDEHIFEIASPEE